MSLSTFCGEIIHQSVAYQSYVERLATYFTHTYYWQDNQFAQAWLGHKVAFPLKSYIRRYQTQKGQEPFVRLHTRLEQRTYYLLSQLASASDIADMGAYAMFLLAWRLPEYAKEGYVDIMTGELV